MEEGKLNRAKKNVASKFANSSAGKSLIIKTLGEESKEMLKLTSTLMKYAFSKKEVKEWKNNVFKFSVKIYLLVTKNKLDKSVMMPMKEKLVDLMKKIIEIFSLCEKSNDVLTDSKIQETSELIVRLRKQITEDILAMIGEHMQEKNKEALAKTICLLDGENAILVLSKSKTEELTKMSEMIKGYLLKANTFSPEHHKTKYSPSTINDKYSSAIEVTRKSWKRVEKNDLEEVEKQILSKMENKLKSRNLELGGPEQEQELTRVFSEIQPRGFITTFSTKSTRLILNWKHYCQFLQETKALILNEKSDFFAITQVVGFDAFAKDMLDALFETIEELAQVKSLESKKMKTIKELVLNEFCK